MRRSLAQKVEDAGYAIQEDGTIIGKRGNKLKPWLQTSGYPVVNIVFKKGTRTTTLVHRIIASKYCACYDPMANDVNHKDGNKTNNSAYNLEWVTRRQNCNHYLGFDDYMTLTKDDARKKNIERTIVRRKLNIK